MVQGHHLQLRSPPLMFHNFWQFSIKAAAAHHPIIKKEVDELLSKGVIEPSSCGAGFYSSMFVVPKGTGGLWPMPYFKMPTIRHVWQLIQHSDYAFYIDLLDAYLHIPIVKHRHHFLQFVWHSMSYQWKVVPFGLATASRAFITLTIPILFLWHHKGFLIVIYLDDILVLVCCKRACHFCNPYWFALDCILIFPSLTFTSLWLLVSWDYVGIFFIYQYLYLLIN